MADTTGGERARVVEEAVRMASSLAERATRDVRELTHELVDAGRASGEGSVSFLMTRLMELAGSVTGFVQELQHYELRRRDTLPVVGLVAGGAAVTVVVPAGATEARFAFLLENDLARSVDGVSFVGADDDTEGGPFPLQAANDTADGTDGTAGAGGTAPGGGAGGSGQVRGDGPGSIALSCGTGPWLWGERRRVEGVAAVPAGFATNATARVGHVVRVLDDRRRAPGVVEIFVQPARPGGAPG